MQLHTTFAAVQTTAEEALQFSLNEVPIGIPMPAVYCEIIKHAVGPRVASELTLFGQVYDLARFRDSLGSTGP
jgi:enoyl-CoA hydratase/carnithine racemase